MIVPTIFKKVLRCVKEKGIYMGGGSWQRPTRKVCVWRGDGLVKMNRKGSVTSWRGQKIAKTGGRQRIFS